MSLKSLSQHRDIRFEGGAYDVRSWQVRRRPQNDVVGHVDDVLVDDDGRTRYLDVELEDSRRHVLLPAGQAEADLDENIVWLAGLGKDELVKLPEYRHDPAMVHGDYERDLTSTYEQSYAEGAYYDRPEYGSRWGRGRTPEAEGAPERLMRLDRLEGIDVAREDPDPRGWEVVGHDGKRIGKVDHLIGDERTMRVRYLTVKLDSDVDVERNRVLVPVGHVDLDTERHHVWVAALDRTRARELPHYEEGRLDRELESRTAALFDKGYTEDRRYEHPRYRDDRLYGWGPRPPRPSAGGSHVDDEALIVKTRRH